MDINSLWIGDTIQIKSSGDIGTFEGLEGNKVVIKINKQLKRFDAFEIELYEQTEQDKIELKLVEDKKTVFSLEERFNFKPEIDLHIEKLNPSYTFKHTAEVLSFQLNKFNTFLNNAIQLKVSIITIIHGRGKGVLKQEILSILQTHKNVSVINEVNNGGALAVWLK